MIRSLLLIAICILPTLSVGAEDWPEWRGPNRTDISPETGLMQSWPEGGPDQVWMSREGGIGYAGFSVVGERLFTMGAEGDEEFVLCLNSLSGDLVWKQVIGAKYENERWGSGPRATPTVDGDHVYVLSGDGTLACLEIGDGSESWSCKMQDFGGRVPNWGYCESVLVDGDQVVCTPGGSQGAVIALNKTNGDLVWQCADFTEGAQYSSIIRVEHYGKPQYIQMTQKSVVGVDPESGALLWQTDFPGQTAVIPTPIYQDGMVYVTAGYGAGCKRFRVTENNEVEDGYRNTNMVNHHGGVILVDGHFYGYSNSAGWTCQDAETGERVWNNRSDLGKGAIAYADGCFYCLDERSGEVVLISASSEGWDEKGRFTLDPQTELRADRGAIWTHPVIANGKLYLRDQELIFCFDIKAK